MLNSLIEVLTLGLMLFLFGATYDPLRSKVFVRVTNPIIILFIRYGIALSVVLWCVFLFTRAF